MGEIFHALEVLNRSMRLGLSAQDLMRAEMGFKSALAMQGNPAAARLAGDPARLTERYEIVARLRPRAARMSLNQLSTLAGQAVRTPRTRVEAATFRKIDDALATTSRVTTKVTTPVTTTTRLRAAKKGVARKARRKG